MVDGVLEQLALEYARIAPWPGRMDCGTIPARDVAAVAGSRREGFDIARSVWLTSGSTLAQPSGYMLDGFGGPHPFGGAPALNNYAYWPGQDIAKN